MHKNTGNQLGNNQQGIVLLSVVVSITVALTVGVAIAARSQSMSSRVARTDTYSRLTATVEGGAERFLVLDDCTLHDMSQEDISDNDFMDICIDVLGMSYEESSPKACVVHYNPDYDSGDRIETKAIVSVSEFNYNASFGDGSEYYAFSMEKGQMKEIPLYDSSGDYEADAINVCWDSNLTALYYLAYDVEAEHVKRGGFYPDNAGFENPLENTPGFEVADVSSRPEFLWCAEVPLDFLTDDRYGLRIKSLYNGANFGIYPESGSTLPLQGYRITSVGELAEEAEQKAVRVLSVYRSYPYMPDVFDYAIYTQGALQ